MQPTSHVSRPHCFKRLPFDTICMDLAQQLASRSHCVSWQVGAVVALDERIVSTGYNGPPAASHNCDEEWPTTGCMRDLQGGCLLSLHAEQNAIFYALNNQLRLTGSTLYSTLAPCLPCARLIFLAGAARVVYLHSYAAYKGLSYEEGVLFLQKFGIVVEQYALDTNSSATQ